IVTIEIAYFAFLALLHVLAHDLEPRALARSGQGGGYLGWALGGPMFKLFGSGLATVLFSSIIVIALGRTFGISRKHLREGLTATSKGLEAFAERMKREPQPRLVPPGKAPMAAPKPANVPARQSAPAAPAGTRASEPMVRPRQQPEPVEDSPVQPAKLVIPAAPPVIPARPVSALATQPDLDPAELQ